MRGCSVVDCGRIHLARGFCKLHYARWRRNGDPGQSEPIRERNRQVNHGTVNEYVSWGCRCEQCRAAWATYFRAYRHRRGWQVPLDEYRRARAEAAQNSPHGTENKYKSCRCNSCRAAATKARRLRRQRAAV